MTAEPDVQYSTHLNNSDALLWNIEKDPCLRTTIVAISLLDRSPDWKRLVERLTEASEQVPRLRQRVATTPMRLGLPRWQADEHFDIGYHLRRVVVPEPGDLRAVLDLAGPLAMAAFDKDRPLWEFTLVEGLTRGRAALIQKVHHSFTDGIGAIRMAELMLDSRRDAPHRHPEPRPLAPSNGGLMAATESLVNDVRSAVLAPARAARVLPGLTRRAVTDPLGLARSTVRGARSVGKLLAPVTEPLSPTMRGRGLGRHLDAFDVPIDDLLAAAHAADCSLNDAFLASIAGGMRRYHDQHGVHVESLRVTMPINLRHEGDELGSNRFTPARFALPVATLDAAARMRQLGELARNWRDEPALPLSDMIAGVLDRLPVMATTALFGSMLKGIDFVATNVPGLRRKSFLAGAEIIREYAFGPPSGAAFSVALLSHLDQCCVGINTDTMAVKDPDQLTSCIIDGFDEVVAVGKRS